MLRALSNRLPCAFLKAFNHSVYFSSEDPRQFKNSVVNKYRTEINILNSFIASERAELNPESASIPKTKVKKRADPLKGREPTLRGRVKRQKWKTLMDAAKSNPELMQILPEARNNAMFYLGGLDFGLDIHPKGPVGPPSHSGKYFDSLGYRRRNIIAEKSIDEKIRENEMQFVDAYTKPNTPAKIMMTREEMEVVHLEIDKRMQELEDTGLTRYEILNKPKGKNPDLPLKDDPVFQLIKENRAARELLITGHEEFCADNVIRKALEQNMGPDPSIANINSHYISRRSASSTQKSEYCFFYRSLMKHENADTPLFQPQDWYYRTNPASKKSQQVLRNQPNPPISHRMPMGRKMYRKVTLRRLRKRDITWDKCSLLVNFLNPSGLLLNRLQTHLKTRMQKHVRRVVSFTRSLGLLPSCGTVRPTDKLDLRPLIEDIHKFDLKTIDAKTGTIINRDLRYTYTEMLDKGLNFENNNAKKEYFHLTRRPFVDEFTIDRDIRAPVFEQVLWDKAQRHIVREVRLGESVERGDSAGGRGKGRGVQLHQGTAQPKGRNWWTDWKCTTCPKGFCRRRTCTMNT
eukprot:TRINITY_DN1170_c0_g1_i4.p1 TRINITY_DN1170_c0_g1~~TRINITY_DN1170_c0_g1_i4.p1  ORF type:complete len:575 (+),score=141.98 TRINITY_DN1170_c0_g1_i4:160-1884(+)